MHLRSTGRRLASTVALALPVAITASGLAVAIDYADDPEPVGRGSAAEGEGAGPCAHLVAIPATTSAVLAPGCPGAALDVGDMVVSALGTGPTTPAGDLTGHCLIEAPARQGARSASVRYHPAQPASVRFASVQSRDGQSRDGLPGTGQPGAGQPGHGQPRPAPSASAPSPSTRASSLLPDPTGGAAPAGSAARPGPAERAPSAGGAAPDAAPTAPQAVPEPIARAVPALVEQPGVVALPPAPPRQQDIPAPAWAPPAPVLGSTLAALHHA